jgi:hypothetical protein
MSTRLGRPYRVFNFSMGGADIPTYPILYRLARSVARPREVWLVAPVSVPRRKTSPGTLDEQLLDGPIGRYDRIPGGIKLSREFHELPLIRFAPAIRDMVVYKPLLHRPATNLDIYHIDDHGDTVSWLYNVHLYEQAEQLKLDRRWELVTFTKQPNAAELAKHDRIYFHPRALAFMAELRDMLRADGVALKIVAFDHAAALGMRDNEFLDASRNYYDKLSRVLDAPLVDVRREFELAPYMVSDITHLNAIGAREFSRVLAARMAGAVAAPGPRYEVTEKIRYRLPDPTWSIFDALVPRRAGDPSEALELRYVQTWGVSPLPVTSEVAVQLRLPDGRDVTLPTRMAARGLAIADTSSLPLAGHDVVVRARLVTTSGNVGAALSQPLQDYAWSAQKPPIAPR